MTTDGDRMLREHLVELLRGGNAHLPFEQATAGLSSKLCGARPQGLPWSPWEILEHVRIAQWDIVEFCIDAGHESPAWPEGYWPASAAPPDNAAWRRSIKAFGRDLERMIRLIEDETNDLYAKIEHGEGQTLLREALVLADHNGYHAGQMIAARRALGAWNE